MSDNTLVSVSFVWKGVAGDSLVSNVFPEDVLSRIEAEFQISAIFASSARPTAVGILNENRVEEVRAYIDQHYPDRISFGIFG